MSYDPNLTKAPVLWVSNLRTKAKVSKEITADGWPFFRASPAMMAALARDGEVWTKTILRNGVPVRTIYSSRFEEIPEG